jgi:hypothetical protein
MRASAVLIEDYSVWTQKSLCVPQQTSPIKVLSYRRPNSLAGLGFTCCRLAMEEDVQVDNRECGHVASRYKEMD